MLRKRPCHESWSLESTEARHMLSYNAAMFVEFAVPQSRKRPYRSAKWGSGHSCVLPHLTTKERPCHVYSDSIPSKHIIGQK